MFYAFKSCRPFTLAEELTHLAHKIDFLGEEGEDDLQNENKEEDSQSESTQDQAKREQQWPWESVRSKLRCADLCTLLTVS